MYSRRDFLSLTGAIGFGGLASIAGCSAPTATPDLKFSYNTTLREKTTVAQRDAIFTTVNKYAKSALSDVYKREITVDPEFTEVSVSGETTEALLSQLERQTPDRQQAQLSHLCLCHTIGTKTPSGRAEMPKPASDCTVTDSDSNLGVVTNTKPLWKLSDSPPQPTVLLRAPEIFPNYFANQAIATVIHEMGHNLCLPHTYGTAWYGTDAPSKYNPVRDDSHIYLSPMLGLYYYEFGGLPNVESEKFEDKLPDFNGTETVHLCTKFRPE